jgi:hypothetical protein
MSDAIEWREETETVVYEWRASVVDSEGREYRAMIEQRDGWLCVWTFDGSQPPPNRGYLIGVRSLDHAKAAAETWLRERAG